MHVQGHDQAGAEPDAEPFRQALRSKRLETEQVQAVPVEAVLGPPNKPAADADVQTGPARADGPVADEQLEVGLAPRPPRSARPWGRRWRPSGAASLAGDARIGTVATRGSRRWTAPGGSCAPFDPAAAVPS